ncbi:MAG TPA: hypothetical protein VLX28_22050, partial [Thermoanaerobaculia bacterium]|nr:hypothetical protein [Thermoanaerobaculia bacterium]
TQQPAATAPRPGGYTGEAIDLLVRNADLKVLLCTLSMVLQKPVWVPRKLDEVVTAFSENLPADQLLDGLSAAAGFVARQEADRWIVGPEARLGNQEAVNACPPPSDDDLSSVPADIPSHLASLREALPELATGDLDLAGLASFKGPWKAYVYTPSQRLISLDAGQELLDAKVGSIGPTGVSYTKGSATVDVPLRP